MSNSTKNLMTKEALHTYAGKNGEYYSQFLERHQQASSFLSWNWSAFFFLPYWLAYRKLWKPLLAVIILQCFIMILAINTLIGDPRIIYGGSPEFHWLLFFAGICFASLMGIGIVLLANSFYLRKAQHIIDHTTTAGMGRSVKALVSSIIGFTAIASALPWMVNL